MSWNEIITFCHLPLFYILVATLTFFCFGIIIIIYIVDIVVRLNGFFGLIVPHIHTHTYTLKAMFIIKIGLNPFCFHFLTNFISRKFLFYFFNSNYHSLHDFLFLSSLDHWKMKWRFPFFNFLLILLFPMFRKCDIVQPSLFYYILGLLTLNTIEYLRMAIPVQTRIAPLPLCLCVCVCCDDISIEPCLKVSPPLSLSHFGSLYIHRSVSTMRYTHQIPDYERIDRLTFPSKWL